jgi:hypothetical protein
MQNGERKMQNEGTRVRERSPAILHFFAMLNDTINAFA